MPDKLEESLIETLSKSGLGDLVETGAEQAIDALLEGSDLLQDVPIVRTFVTAARLAKNVRERLFLKKLLSFLEESAKVSQQDRQEFLNGLDPDDRKELGETLLLYLDRLDSVQKPKMIAQAFVAFMEGRINQREMLTFFFYIDRVFILTWDRYFVTLKQYRHCQQNNIVMNWEIAPEDAWELHGVGFYVQHLIPYMETSGYSGPQTMQQIGIRLDLSDSGWQFIQHVFGLWTDISEPAYAAPLRKRFSLDFPGEGE